MALLTAALMAATLMAIDLPGALTLLRDRLVHQVENTKIVLGVLEVTFRHHPVATARRVPAELQVFLEQLLRRAADPDVRTVAVENVIAVEWDSAALVMAHSAAATAAVSTATPARAMVAATHAFHVHTGAVVLSRYGAA